MNREPGQEESGKETSHFISRRENQECPGEGRESVQRKVLKMISQVWGEVSSIVVQWIHRRRGLRGPDIRRLRNNPVGGGTGIGIGTVEESDCGAERKPAVQGSQYPHTTVTGCARTAQPCVEIVMYP